MDAILSCGTEVDLIWPHILNTLRLIKIDTLVMPEALYPKLDCGTPNLESFELEINYCFVIYLRFILLNSILFKSFFFFSNSRI